jgi:hypothetical protein
MNKRGFLIAVVAMFAIAVPTFASDDSKAGTTEHEVFLEATDHELHVYHIYGKKPGKTILIIGGIHGNEPGGFLAADHYTNVSLERGNLIVVPRTNLASILSNHRGKFGDLNRKFSTKLDESNVADQIIAILKDLMAKSDLVLNLHDGSGFYREKWIDKLHNPFRYGQAIMSDSDVYIDKATGVEVKLAAMAGNVVAKVNSNIEEEEYKFRFANHDSINPDTKYPEMRKTATYFALTEYGIPAYGVETSKALPTLAMKVQHQLFVINAFLEEFDIQIASPGINVEEASIDYVVFSVNDSNLQVVRPGGTLKVRSGDKVKLSTVMSNYQSGLFIDYIGQGGRNDNNREVTVKRSLRAVVRKDATVCCSLTIAPEHKEAVSLAGMSHLKGNYFIIDVNGTSRMVSQGEELPVILGDIVTVKDFLGPDSSKSINVNFQGFVGNPADNRGEDRGYPANTANDLLKNWSEEKQGKKYIIAAKRGRRIISSITLRINEPDFKYLVVNNPENNKAVIGRKGDSVSVQDVRSVVLEDIITNIEDISSLYVRLNSSGKNFKVGDRIPFEADEAILKVFCGSKELGDVSLIRKKDPTEKAAR